MKTFITGSYFVILLHFIAVPLLQAQSEAWERINPKPVEASLYDCSLLPNNRIVAVGSNATVIYSDNFGADWEIIYTPDNISRNIAFNSVDFADEMHGMAVGTYSSVIKTDDGGTTWTDISPVPLDYNNAAYTDVCLRDPSNCFITGGEYQSFLLHSSDGGASWDTAFQTIEQYFNRVQFVDDNIGFLSGKGGNFFYRSSDGGENWNLISVDPGIEDLYLHSLYFITSDIGLFAGETGNNTNWSPIILRTIDGGQSWYQVFTDPYAGDGKFFFINPDTGFAISQVPWYSNSILKTTDSGESWELISDDLGFWSFEGLCMNNEGNGIIVGDWGQIYRSSDFGSSWEEVSVNAHIRFNTSKAFITGDSSILVSLIGGTGGVTDFKVIESFDRGATWVQNTTYPYYGVNDLKFINDSIAFYGGPMGGIYKSVDGGKSWEFYDLGDEWFQPFAIAFPDDQTGFVGGTADGSAMQMYRTQDQGETWIRVFSDVFNLVDIYFPLEIEFKDDSVGFILGGIENISESNIIVTYDRGNSWAINTLPFTNYFRGIDFLNADTGFLYGYGKVLKTINGGHDWSPVTVITEDNLDFISMDFPTSETGYAINSSLSMQSIFKTEDGGDTWNCLSAPASSNLNSINFFTEDEGLLFGDNGLIFRTQTGGMVGISDPGINSIRESVWKCYPNPFSSITIISALKDISSGIVLRIFDFTGKPVRYYSGSSAAAGESFFIWDGRNDSGNELSPGIYIICINYKSSQEMMKIVKF